MIKQTFFALIVLVSMLYYPLAFEEFETPKSMALIGFSCLAVFFVQWKFLLKDRVAQTMMLFLVSALISTIFSIDQHMSIFGNHKAPMGLLTISSLFVVYMTACQVFEDKNSINQAIDLLLACSFLIAAYAILQAFGYDVRQWNGVLRDSAYTRPMSFLGHPNFMANYLAMTLPFAIFKSHTEKRAVIKALLFSLVVILCAAIFLSLSRGMIIAAVASSAAYFILSRRHAKQVICFFSVTAVASVCLLVSMPGFKKDASLRMDSIVTPGAARKEYPKGAIRIWEKSPWIGIGTDTFELGFRNQRDEYYWKIERGGSPHRAHNDFLNVLATQGIFGSIAATLLTAAVFFRSIKARSQIAIAAVSAIAAFYVAGLTSFVIVSTGTLFVICLAIIKNENT